MKKAPIHIGTSGWHYSHWKENYYPQSLPSVDFLPFYAREFQTVEINNTFYRIPEIETIQKWKKEVPQNFVFSVKMSRLITHRKKLNEPKKALKNFFNAIRHLKGKLGVILIQLPPKWKLNLMRLEQFLKVLPKSYHYAFELRDSSWLCEEVFSLLQKHGHALCLYEIDEKKTPQILTADFVYIRLHGPKKAYLGNYSSYRLNQWAKKIELWSKKGIEVFCYFDNDEKGYAPKNALSLIKKLS